MAGSPSDRVLRQVHRLFNFGAVGTMSDAELLDRFVSRRDEAAEAAFEELVSRHGPMVFRVCRSVLCDAHDAEDASQAVFLVLANRARSIRRHESVASWLFGVAHRVAIRSKRSAARRRALDHFVAERTFESYHPPDGDLDREILHEEIHRLPERLRAPVVLCYLQGLTYAAAARQLGLSEVAIQGRLARARERLRHRLIRRGVTLPAGLFAAGAASQAQAAIPLTLIQGTSRIAQGFLAGNTAAALARGVLNSMLLNQVRVGTVLILLGIGSSYWAWCALAEASDREGKATPKQAAVGTTASAPKSQTTAPATIYRFTGSVRVEGTGEPVAGATVDVLITSSGQGPRAGNRTARSGADGRYIVELPPGSARSWTLIAPVGYWAPRDPWFNEDFAVSREESVHRRDYVVRRGTVWDFRITRDHGVKPLSGVVWASDEGNSFRSIVGDAGRVRLTLPTEGGQVRATALESLMADDPVPMTLEWQSGFRPDAVTSVTSLGGSPARYILNDHSGKTATLTVPGKGLAAPRLDGGKLIVEVTLPEPDPKAFADLTGKVVDTSGRPVAGASVALTWVGQHGVGMMSAQDRHRAMTDVQGDFRLRSIPRADSTGKPVTISLTVTKEGLAGVDTKPFHFRPGAGNASQVAEPLTLAPGVSVSGTVVDPDGKPLVGAWITPGPSFANSSKFTKTDDAGRFTVHDLTRGMAILTYRYGRLMAEGRYLALHDLGPLTIKVHPVPDAAQFQARSDAAKAARDRTPPLALGTPAPAWESGAWSDGQSRKLAVYRGKVVVLDFCGGTSCVPLGEVASLEKLRARYEPLGVAFLVLHSPGEDEKNVRAVFEMNQSSLIFAIDHDRKRDEDFDRNGMTAARYGVRSYPTLVMIDRRGQVAYHSGGVGAKEGVAAMLDLGKEMGIEVDRSRTTEADSRRLWEAFFGREIEKILNRP
jgi:RNA polymerase sigma factor (sigma-70 family)